ncbi:MAG TPA: hypothetical protein DD414_04605 [Lachnospiraceae bacterium]|nr:hypothetical protein [Lachnospiraceae bacterium]
MARKKVILTIIFFLVICTLLFFIRGYPPGRSRLPPLKATLLKVGKADAIIVQSDNYAMVIDAGEEEDGEEVTAFLNNQGITCVDTLIITHFDKDHVGGADTLVESVKVGRVLLPYYEGVSTEYLDFMKALKQTGLKPERLSKPLNFKIGEASVLVEPPLSYQVDSSQAENDNNFSLITTITHGENVLLFTGDMEKQRIRKWVS